jgi:Trk K+ transport system NAD-binding subunit
LIPEGIRIGLIKRHDKILVPDKNTIIEENDEIILLSLSKSLHQAEELFQVRGEF